MVKLKNETRQPSCKHSLSTSHCSPLITISYYVGDLLSTNVVVRDGECAIIFVWQINFEHPNYIWHSIDVKKILSYILFLSELVNALYPHLYAAQILVNTFSSIFYKNTFTTSLSALTLPRIDSKNYICFLWLTILFLG